MAPKKRQKSSASSTTVTPSQFLVPTQLLVPTQPGEEGMTAQIESVARSLMPSGLTQTQQNEFLVNFYRNMSRHWSLGGGGAAPSTPANALMMMLLMNGTNPQPQLQHQEQLHGQSVPINPSISSLSPVSEPTKSYLPHNTLERPANTPFQHANHSEPSISAASPNIHRSSVFVQPHLFSMTLHHNGPEPPGHQLTSRSVSAARKTTAPTTSTSQKTATNFVKCKGVVIPQLNHSIIQQTLDINQVLVDILLEYQNNGLSNDPRYRIYAAKLQHNLYYLAAAADIFTHPRFIPPVRSYKVEPLESMIDENGAASGAYFSETLVEQPENGSTAAKQYQGEVNTILRNLCLPTIVADPYPSNISIDPINFKPVPPFVVPETLLAPSAVPIALQLDLPKVPEEAAFKLLKERRAVRSLQKNNNMEEEQDSSLEGDD